MSKIFAIGFNKCGTSSLCEALRILGYKADHSSTELIVKRGIKEKKPPLHYVKRHFDAFTDNSWISRNYELVDKHYPGSKFILLVRNVDDWIRSRIKHVTKNRINAAKGKYDGEWLTIDEPRWRKEWYEYLPKAKHYFKNRPKDFLVIDVCKGEGWEKLCPFLGKKVPDKKFPRENVTK